MFQVLHSQQLLASRKRHCPCHQGHVSEDVAVRDERKAAIGCAAHQWTEKRSVDCSTAYQNPSCVIALHRSSLILLRHTGDILRKHSVGVWALLDYLI
jgi:hypothetical protein